MNTVAMNASATKATRVMANPSPGNSRPKALSQGSLKPLTRP
jgi:hypothetical protein